jgi:uncharacterized protein YgiM (DUF1202 family)
MQYEVSGNLVEEAVPRKRWLLRGLATASAFFGVWAITTDALAIELKTMNKEQQVAKQALELLSKSVGCAVEKKAQLNQHVITYKAAGNERTLLLEVMDQNVNGIAVGAKSASFARYHAPYSKIAVSQDHKVVEIGCVASDEACIGEETSQPLNSPDEAVKSLKKLAMTYSFEVEFCDAKGADNFVTSLKALVAYNQGKPTEEDAAWSKISQTQDVGAVLLFLGKYRGWPHDEAAREKLAVLADKALPQEIDAVLVPEGRHFFVLGDPGETSLSENGAKVKVRSGPGGDFRLNGVVTRGEELSSSGRVNEWIKVSSAQGVTGYIERTNIVVASDMTELKEMQSNVEALDAVFSKAGQSTGPYAKYAGVYSSIPCDLWAELKGMKLLRALYWFRGNDVYRIYLRTPTQISHFKIVASKPISLEKYGRMSLLSFRDDVPSGRDQRGGFTKGSLWFEKPDTPGRYSPYPRCEKSLAKERVASKDDWLTFISQTFQEKGSYDFQKAAIE